MVLQKRVDAWRWPIREEFTNCTHIIVSILKAWKLTMVGLECGDARRSITEIFLSSKCLFQNSERYKLDYRDIVKYRYEPYVITDKLLQTHFLC